MNNTTGNNAQQDIIACSIVRSFQGARTLPWEPSATENSFVPKFQQVLIQAPGLESLGSPGAPGPAPLLIFRPLPTEPPKGHFSAGSPLTPPVLSLTLYLPTAERS